MWIECGMRKYKRELVLESSYPSLQGFELLETKEGSDW